MLLGTNIIQAPGCKNLLQCTTVLSGNTFGARYWTDGKMEARMLPDEPRIRKSRVDDVLFWMDECEIIAEIDVFDLTSRNREWERLKYAEKLTEQDYARALESGMANTQERELHLRTQFWWAGNDNIRREIDKRERKRNRKPPGPIRRFLIKARLWPAQNREEVEISRLPQSHLDNIQCMLPLLSEDDPTQKLMKAEVLRHLSRFEEAMVILDAPWPEGYSQAAQRIRELATLHDDRVAEIN